jgi:hypothetical protein
MLAFASIISISCDTEPPADQSYQPVIPTAVVPPEVREPSPPSAPSSTGTAAVEPDPRPPWTGPFLGITRSSTGIYAAPSFAREKKIGYAQEGAKVPILPEKVSTADCSDGWYQLVDGGYVCGNHGTKDLSDPRVKLGPSQPNLAEILPYRYARNVKNGTPLYKSVPSKEQLERYEPHLFASEATKPVVSGATSSTPPADPATLRAQEDQERRMAALRAARRAMLGEAAAEDQPTGASEPVTDPARAAVAEPAEPPPDKRWWEEEEPELHKLSITDLGADSDDVLASRMVKGFYIAVDKVFDWNKRRWFRSTRGFVAPADAFHFATGSDFKGVELGGEVQLPVGFVYGPKDRSQYSFDDGKTLKTAGTAKRFSMLPLTGEEMEHGGKVYVKTRAGNWLRKSDLRIALAAPPPEGLGADEVWIDVNLSTQTLVASRGDTPFFATLVSTGKHSKDPEKDHSTPTGSWRIREKHITATMDGDGTAAGDLPYSIEGVPYVMYFHKAYALHGAFWHQNYGVQMSHGCVNLAPLDAKYLFLNTGPEVTEGLHGGWATEDRPGALVVVHE